MDGEAWIPSWRSSQPPPDPILPAGSGDWVHLSQLRTRREENPPDAFQPTGACAGQSWHLCSSTLFYALAKEEHQPCNAPLFPMHTKDSSYPGVFHRLFGNAKTEEAKGCKTQDGRCQTTATTRARVALRAARHHRLRVRPRGGGGGGGGRRAGPHTVPHTHPTPPHPSPPLAPSDAVYPSPPRFRPSSTHARPVPHRQPPPRPPAIRHQQPQHQSRPPHPPHHARRTKIAPHRPHPTPPTPHVATGCLPPQVILRLRPLVVTPQVILLLRLLVLHAPQLRVHPHVFHARSGDSAAESDAGAGAAAGASAASGGHALPGQKGRAFGQGGDR